MGINWATRHATKPPLVSVIIPVVRPDLASQALAAIATQKWNGPIETIVVHDGGEPLDLSASSELWRSIGVQPQAGAAVARNVAVAASHGEILAFCDDDDLWDPNHLACTVPLAVKSGGLVYTDALVYHLDEGWKAPFRFRCSPEILRHTLPVMFSTLVVPRCVWDQVGQLDPQLSRYGDWDWVLRASNQGVPILRVPKSTITYRFSGRSASSNRGAMAAELQIFIQKHQLTSLPVSDFATMVHHPDWAQWRDGSPADGDVEDCGSVR
jgi:glycosyltransferase involved in cell wall biosynthesis